jgi:prepilin-type N-terminal cleavage/methylation domain-containing protein
MKLTKIFKAQTGHNLIEVMLALTIAAIFMTAFITVYFYGIREFSRISSVHQMQSEGQTVLKRLEKYIRMAKAIDISGSSDSNRRKLTVTLPDTQEDATSGGDIEYFYNSSDKTLRMNDRRIGHNDIFVQLLPIPTGQRSRRFGTQSNSFDVKQISFQYGDTLAYAGAVNAGYIVLIDLVLEDTLRYNRNNEGHIEGNIVSLESCTSRLN